jgi:UPF0042 nucleotide-binding protein
MEFLILTGMSGAGKSTALKMIEDMGYFCVDNLPIALIEKFAELAYLPESGLHKVALGVDVRSGSGQRFEELQKVFEQLTHNGIRYEILFLDADDSVLIKRYKETRRIHPLAPMERIATGIAQEREKLVFLKEQADYIINTSHLLTRELKVQLDKILIQKEDYRSLNITILSFGFKYGIPTDSDLVFDVRFLPNPYYIDELKQMTGNDAKVHDYVMQFHEARAFLDKVTDLLKFLIPNYISEGKSQLVISVGCTGGKHRSVTLANELYVRLSEQKEYGLKIEHRDITKDSLRGK